MGGGKYGGSHSPPRVTPQESLPPRGLGGSDHTLTRSGGLGGFFWTRPKACRGSPRGGSWGRAPRTPEKFFFVKNPMKITILGQFFKLSMKILRFLQNNLKIKKTRQYISFVISYSIILIFSISILSARKSSLIHVCNLISVANLKSVLALPSTASNFPIPFTLVGRINALGARYHICI